MDGLTHPRDLEAWHRWQHASQPLGRRVERVVGVLRDIARPGARAGQVVVTRGGPEPRVLVCLESRTPASEAALLAPLRDVHPEDVVVVSPERVRDVLPSWTWAESTTLASDALPGLAEQARVVLSAGHHLPLGHIARSAVGGRDTGDDRRFVTVQHGLLTPHAPPLAEGTTLLAWSEADAGYWRSGRDDVHTTVVGAQLLWDAGRPPTAVRAPQVPPVFLGQLNATELPREALADAAESFCRAEHATYRPHPGELDRGSVAVHERLEAAGVPVDRSGAPLRDLGAPVVSVFSAGVLEAAAAGLPAWVTFADPPPWLSALWARYAMAPWGGPPTAAPHRPATEPARAVAAVVQEMTG
ncbi:hypothetical protein GCM10023168_25280 [Fodinibacter luteus]|uniref:RNA-binding protein n=1 Tax=Fodinibacter luteus TaxID=552064 RepID=A0ABP8KJX4_9MICO